jgi:photosystem II stability/assembly factor-like uncharacterized protein
MNGRRTLAAWAASAALLAGAARAQDSHAARAIVSGTAHQALFAIAVDGTAALAVGAAGEIQQSADSGKTWAPAAALPTQLGLLGVTMAAGHAIAVGQMGTVLLRDGGGTWTAAASGVHERLFAVALNSHGVAAAVGAFGTILRSVDRGRTWASVSPDWSSYAADGEQPHLYDVAVNEAGVMTVAGEFGLILRSLDGHDWKTLHKGDASLFALDLRADGGGFAVGQNGTVLHTADGGATWQAQSSASGAILLGVRSAASGSVVASGMHEMLSSTDGGRSWTRMAGSGFASGWYQGIASAQNGHAWLVVGNAGQVLMIDH